MSNYITAASAAGFNNRIVEIRHHHHHRPSSAQFLPLETVRTVDLPQEMRHLIHRQIVRRGRGRRGIDRRRREGEGYERG